MPARCAVCIPDTGTAPGAGAAADWSLVFSRATRWSAPNRAVAPDSAAVPLCRCAAVPLCRCASEGKPVLGEQCPGRLQRGIQAPGDSRALHRPAPGPSRNGAGPHRAHTSRLAAAGPRDVQRQRLDLRVRQLVLKRTHLSQALATRAASGLSSSGTGPTAPCTPAASSVWHTAQVGTVPFKKSALLCAIRASSAARTGEEHRPARTAIAVA